MMSTGMEVSNLNFLEGKGKRATTDPMMVSKSVNEQN